MKDFIESICPKEGQLQKVYYRKEDKDDFYFKMNLMDELKLKIPKMYPRNMITDL